jgi:GTP-binding protein LepA
MDNIRNFCIIAHIDHGKSTLADRFLEITETVDSRKMKEQYLDGMELERERGITIKMAPVRMVYHTNVRINTDGKRINTNEHQRKLADNRRESVNQVEYILNLIDTPGHSDFSYEVSRALAAVEGGILLVDGKQGIQAQTLSNFRSAKKAGLTLLGVINKIDLFKDRSELDNLIAEVAELLEISMDEVYLISAKTGEGITELLEGVVLKFPSPKHSEYAVGNNNSRALVFDSFYDNHKGVIVSVRVFDGEFKDNQDACFLALENRFKIKELGYFSPEMKMVDSLKTGQIGYIATGLKNPEKVRIGDTISNNKRVEPLPGYKEPKSAVFVSFYPEDKDEYSNLNKSLEKLKLNDSSLTIDGDRNKVLGRGFKVGFLGKLHYEITSERLRQEFGINTIHTFPSVKYRIETKKSNWEEITQPEDLPENYEKIEEPMIKIEVLLPSRFLNNLISVQHQFRMEKIEVSTAIPLKLLPPVGKSHEMNPEAKQVYHKAGGNILASAYMPLSELIIDFDNVLKSITEGYASFSYELVGYKEVDMVKVDFLVSKERIPGISRFFLKENAARESRKITKRLKKYLPKQQYSQPIQAVIGGNIIAREDIPAFRKDVTGHLYGGDVTRKMKLREKQKKGKKKLKERSGAKLNEKVFKELLKR